MELFEFKRYVGDVCPSSSDQQTGIVLDDYLENVKQRKRLREQEACRVQETSPNENETSEQANFLNSDVISRKKKKKDERIYGTKEAFDVYLERVKLRKQRREERLNKQSATNDKGDGAEECISADGITAAGEENKVSFVATSKNKSKKAKKASKEQSDVEAKESPDIDTSDKFRDEVKTESDPNKSTKNSRKKKKKKKKKVVIEDENVDNNNVEITKKKEEPVVSFEVLGAHSFQDKVKVKRVLPRWLAEPTVISAELTSRKNIEEVGKLHFKLVQNLKKLGIEDLFPVQLAVIPYQLRSYNKIHYLWPRDLCISAPTGSGKTLAYVLPILQAHYYMPKSGLYALVVVPVQELALQVAKVFRDVAVGTGIKVGCITGGTDMGDQAKSLVFKRDDGTFANLIHILVATPGRLMEHFFLTPGFNLKNIRFIVIDEADRVVEQRSLNWLHLIEQQCDVSFSGNLPPVTFHNLKNNVRGPQKLLFSATLSQDPEKLLKLNLFQPKLITSISNIKNIKEKTEHFYGKFTTPESLKESYAVCDGGKKPLLIHKLLLDGWRRVLVFTKSCVEANRLYNLLKYLNPNVEIGELTSLMILNKRRSVVREFSCGDVNVLVSSDRMARGMDIKSVDYVIIYDPPKHVKGYIHKAGRTGRAGLPGTALTVVTQKQSSTFLGMLKKAGKTDLEPFHYDPSELESYMSAYAEALEHLKSYISSQKNSTINFSIKEKRTKTTVNVKKRKRRAVFS